MYLVCERKQVKGILDGILSFSDSKYSTASYVNKWGGLRELTIVELLPGSSPVIKDASFLRKGLL